VNVLITGSTDGLGANAAKRFSANNYDVIVHGRDAARGERVVDDIRTAGGNATFHRADLASLRDVRALAQTIAAEYERIDVLVNNAGIGAGTQKQTSVDGFELRFAVNYLAGFLLTRLLLPTVLAAGNGRVINVSSLGQQAIDFDDVMIDHDYSGVRAYRQSKLAQILFTFDLADELRGRAVANCLHPATFMDTTMVRADGVTPISTIDKGADAVMRVAALPAGETGRFFDVLEPKRANAQAYDLEARATLRELTEVLVAPWSAALIR